MIRLGHIKVSDMSKELVNQALNEDKLGQNDIIPKFEMMFALWAGARYAVAVGNGTMADTVALAVLKFLNPGKDEIILPALTFVAQANAVYYNHLKPVFVDVTPSLLMRPEDAATHLTSKTLCVFPVHLMGKPCDMLGYQQMTRAHKVAMVEDACEAMGSEFNPGLTGWKKCGTFGDMGTYSFFPSHTITTGEGGMIVTNNPDLAELCRKFANHGKKSPFNFSFDAIGYNGKMSSLQAAVGLGALPDIATIVSLRRQNFKALGGTEDERMELVCPHGMVFKTKSREHREACLEILRQNGIECRNLFSSLPTQETLYKDLGYRLGDFPNAERIGDTHFYAPVHHGLAAEDIEKIKTITKALVCEPA